MGQYEGMKQGKMIRLTKTKSEIWGKNFLVCTVNTGGLNINDKSKIKHKAHLR